MSITLSRSNGVASLTDAVLPDALPKRRPYRFGWRWVAALAVTDVCMFLVAALAAAEIVKSFGYTPDVRDSVSLSMFVYAGFWLLIFERLGLYRRSFALSMKDELYYTAAALALGALPQLLLFTLLPAVSSSRAILLLAVALASLTVGSARAGLHLLRTSIAARHPWRVAIVGREDSLGPALTSLNFQPGTRILSLVVPDVEQSVVDAHDHARGPGWGDPPWLRQARAWGCDAILLTEVLPPHVVPTLLEKMARDQIFLAFAPPQLRAHAYDYSIRMDGHQALIVPFRLRACRWDAQLAKRTMDLIVASAACIVALPIMLVAAIAIMVESGGPVFFKQERVGRHGRVFTLLKFRTMKVDAESATGPVWAARKDPRKTAVGAFLRRTSIDELPQLFNVLRGEMSLVGPRPERPAFVAAFRERLPRYDERHLVQPGITGWSQVHMDRVLAVGDVSEKLSHDLFYVENWSLFMDASLIVKTGFEVLFHRAA